MPPKRRLENRQPRTSDQSRHLSNAKYIIEDLTEGSKSCALPHINKNITDLTAKIKDDNDPPPQSLNKIIEEYEEMIAVYKEIIDQYKECKKIYGMSVPNGIPKTNRAKRRSKKTKKRKK